jgi:hypothetical protein
MVTMRSFGEIKKESALSRVVLPAPGAARNDDVQPRLYGSLEQFHHARVMALR